MEEGRDLLLSCVCCCIAVLHFFLAIPNSRRVIDLKTGTLLASLNWPCVIRLVPGLVGPVSEY